LMELDCIPAGMELFPAMDEEQLDFIKRVIDDCDYYILIIGGRYGSTTAEGVSYTEKEYDYAIERGIKVLAFLHGKPGDISNDKSELDPELRLRLDTFRGKASTGRLVKSWTKAEELPGLVALSLSKTIKTYPAIGWVRANHIANVDALGELNELRKRNEELEKLVNESGQGPSVVEGLAGLDELIELSVEIRSSAPRLAGSLPYSSKQSVIIITIGDVFLLVAPELLTSEADKLAKQWIEIYLKPRVNCDDSHYVLLNRQDFQTIKIQFLALGLIVVNELNRWCLTNKGKNTLMQLRTVKSSK
jgi:hypothetical protein